VAEPLKLFKTILYKLP